MRVIASVVIGAGLLLMGGAAQAMDMGDLDVTIRVIDSDEHDPKAVTNEISLPDLSREKVEHEQPDSSTTKVETDAETRGQDTRDVTGTTDAAAGADATTGTDATEGTSSFRDRMTTTDTTAPTRVFSRGSTDTTKPDLKEEMVMPKTSTEGADD